MSLYLVSLIADCRVARDVMFLTQKSVVFGPVVVLVLRHDPSGLQER